MSYDNKEYVLWRCEVDEVCGKSLMRTMEERMMGEGRVKAPLLTRSGYPN